MSGEFKFKWNRDSYRDTDDMKATLQKVLKNEVAKGCDPYVPYDFGKLAQSVEASIGTDEPFLVYNVPYAEKQYYGLQNKARDNHEHATRYWFEVWKAADGKSVIDKIRKGAARWFRRL